MDNIQDLENGQTSIRDLAPIIVNVAKLAPLM
jgi:hypothetical protein